MWIPRSFKGTTVKIYVHSSHSFWLKLSTVAQDCKNICLLGQVMFGVIPKIHRTASGHLHIQPHAVQAICPTYSSINQATCSTRCYSHRCFEFVAFTKSTIRNLGCSCVKTVLRCVVQYNIIWIYIYRYIYIDRYIYIWHKYIYMA